MSNSYVQVFPDQTGKKVATSELTVSGNTVERQHLIITDSTDPSGLAVVVASAPAGTEYGLITRNIPSGTQTVTGSLTVNAGTNLNTSLLALDTSVNGILLLQGSTTSGQYGPLIQGAVTTAAPTYVTGNTYPLSLTTSGEIRVQPSSGGNSVTINTNNASTVSSSNGMQVLTHIVGAGQTYSAGKAAMPAMDLSGRAYISGQGSNNAGLTGNPVWIAGSDGTNAQSLIVTPINSTIGNGLQALTAIAGLTTYSTGKAAMPAVDLSGKTYVTGQAANGTATQGNPLWVAGSDGTNAVALRVKPASTAATATDTALVVAISPNNSIAITASGLPLPTGAATSANQSTEITALGTINTTLGSPMQDTGGTVGLVAGSAIIGSVRIDQTTPGTTNGVIVNGGSLSLSGGSTEVKGTTAVGAPIPNPVVIGGADPYGNTYPFAVAEQGVVFPVTSMFPIAGIDGSNTAQPIGIAASGSVAPSYVLQVGGVDFAGLARPLAVASGNGAANPGQFQLIGGSNGGAGSPSYTLPIVPDNNEASGLSVTVGGKDGQGGAQSLPIGVIGSTPTSLTMTVGGRDGGGNAIDLGIMSTGGSFDFNRIIPIAGVDYAGTAWPIPTSLIGYQAAPFSLTVGGTETGGLARQLPVAAVGNANNGNVLQTGGVDSAGNAQLLGVAPNATPAPANILLVGGYSGSNTMAPLPVIANGSSAGSNGLLVSGIDLSNVANQLSVTSEGGASFAHSLLVGGLDASNNQKSLGVARQSDLYPTSNVLAVGGMDSSGNMQVFGNNLLGKAASSYSTNVNGIDNTGTARHLGVSVTGAASPSNVLQVGGVDGSSNSQPLGVATLGQIIPSNALLVGGMDSFGNMMQIGVSQTSSTFNYNSVLGVGGVDGNGNTWPLPIAGTNTTTSGFSVTVGGVDGNNSQQPLGVAEPGTLLGGGVFTPNILLIGGTDGANQARMLGIGPVGTQAPIGNVLLTGGITGDSPSVMAPLAINTPGGASSAFSLLTGGIDGSNQHQPLSVSPNNTPGFGTSLSVGGIGGDGNLHPLGVNTNAGTKSIQILAVGGDDGAKAWSLPVSSVGGVTNGHVLIAGGVDKGGNSVPFGISSDSTNYVNHLLMVGGNDGTTAYGLPVSATSGVVSGRVLIVGGADGATNAQKLGVSALGSTHPTTILQVGGIGATGSDTFWFNPLHQLYTIDASSVAQSTTTSGATGMLIQGAVTTVAPTYSNGNTNPLSLDTNGSLRVTVTSGGGSNASVGLTGTTAPTSATEMGVIDAGNLVGLTTGQTTMAHSVPVVIASNQSALAITAASLPLPTGAATSANQSTEITALGTINTTLGSPMQQTGGSVTANAGTNLNTSFLALDTSVNGIVVVQGSSTAGQKNTLIAGAVTTAAPLYSTGTTNPLSIDVNGNVRVYDLAAKNGLSTVNSTLGTPMQNSGGSVTANAGTNLNTSALALDTSVNGIIVAQGSTTSGQKGSLILGAVATSSPTYSNGQSSAFSLDTSGSLRVNMVTGANTNLSVVPTMTPAPSYATVMGMITSGNVVALTTGQTTMANSIPVTLASDCSLTLAQGSTTSGQVGPLSQAAVTSAAPSYTNAQTSPMSLDTQGNLRVMPDIPVAAVTAIAPAQVSVGSSATLIFTATTNIQNITIQNQGTVPVFIGFTTAVSATGVGIILNGGVVNLDGNGGSYSVANYSGNIYGIVTTGTCNVGVQAVSSQ